MVVFLKDYRLTTKIRVSIDTCTGKEDEITIIHTNHL